MNEPVGPELDAAVARLLGLHVLPEPWPFDQDLCCGGWLPWGGTGSLKPRPRDWEPEGRFRVYVTFQDAALDHSDVAVIPPYSTDIAAAWIVVEKLQAQGWQVGITAMVDGWVVNARPFGPPDGRLVQVSGDTPCEAICRAALATDDPQLLCLKCGRRPSSGIASRGQMGAHPWCLNCRNADALARKRMRRTALETP